MPIAATRLTASQFRPQDRERLNINRGDRIDMRSTPDGTGVELFVNGRQRHEVTAMEMSVQDMYYRIAYRQDRVTDAARIEAAAAQIRAQSDMAILDELGATEDRVAAADVHLSNLAATPVRLENVGTVSNPDLRFSIPRGQQGAIRADSVYRTNFERWHMPFASGSSNAGVTGEIERDIAELRRHGFEPKVIAVDGNVMSHLRASTVFQWQHRVEAVPADIDDVFAESATQVTGTLFGIRLVEDDQTEGYVIAVKR